MLAFRESGRLTIENEQQNAFTVFIIGALFSLIGFLTNSGFAYGLAFVLVFGFFDLLLLNFIRVKMQKLYGKSRAILIFIYGFGGVSLLAFALIVFGID